jgi:hypothetical protein
LSVSGVSLWLGSPEFYYLMQDKYANSQIWSWYLNPVSNGGFIPSAIASDHHFIDLALASIKSAPDIYILYSFLKLPFFWIGHPAIDWPDYTVFDIAALRPYFSTPHLAGLLAARFLPFVALIGLIILQVLHERIHYLTPLLLICAYFMLIYSLTYPELRYSEPLHPILVTFIAAAIKPGTYAVVKPTFGACCINRSKRRTRWGKEEN